eukprot:SAG31_NODE_19158_length_610_cov_1.403131_1_plen_168_part_01
MQSRYFRIENQNNTVRLRVCSAIIGTLFQCPSLQQSSKVNPPPQQLSSPDPAQQRAAVYSPDQHSSSSTLANSSQFEQPHELHCAVQGRPAPQNVAQFPLTAWSPANMPCAPLSPESPSQAGGAGGGEEAPITRSGATPAQFEQPHEWHGSVQGRPAPQNVAQFPLTA